VDYGTNSKKLQKANDLVKKQTIVVLQIAVKLIHVYYLWLASFLVLIITIFSLKKLIKLSSESNYYYYYYYYNNYYFYYYFYINYVHNETLTLPAYITIHLPNQEQIHNYEQQNIMNNYKVYKQLWNIKTINKFTQTMYRFQSRFSRGFSPVRNRSKVSILHVSDRGLHNNLRHKLIKKICTRINSLLCSTYY